MNRIKINYFVDAIAFISFFVTAVTGALIFIFLPPAEGRGGFISSFDKQVYTIWVYGG